MTTANESQVIKCRTNPREVEAIKWDGANIDVIKEWGCSTFQDYKGTLFIGELGDEEYVPTGWWIVKDPDDSNPFWIESPEKFERWFVPPTTEAAGPEQEIPTQTLQSAYDRAKKITAFWYADGRATAAPATRSQLEDLIAAELVRTDLASVVPAEPDNEAAIALLDKWLARPDGDPDDTFGKRMRELIDESRLSDRKFWPEESTPPPDRYADAIADAARVVQKQKEFWIERLKNVQSNNDEQFYNGKIVAAEFIETTIRSLSPATKN